ncbi:hypothetical protein ACQY0O_003633 [Thecaphora frezii]
MASSLKNILPRSPSPSAASPNPGPRSQVTHFIRSTDTSPIAAASNGAFAGSNADDEAETESPTPSGSAPRRSIRAPGEADAYDAVPLSPRRFSSTQRRLSFGAAIGTSTGHAGRRSIAHSFRVLGVDDEAEEALAMSKLQNGQVDVSWPEIFPDRDDAQPSAAAQRGPTHSSPIKGKGKALAGAPPIIRISAEDGSAGAAFALTDADDTVSLAEVNLEEGGSRASHDGRQRSLYGLKSSSRFNLLSGLGIDKDRGAPAGTLHDGYDSDEGEDLEANKSSYFREVGGGGSSGAGLYSPEGFESVTARETVWMWISVAFVLAVCLVAMLISTDVIDWPGDGIGKL